MGRNGAKDQRRRRQLTVASRPWRQLRVRPTVMTLEDRRLMSVFQVTNNSGNVGTSGSLTYELGLANANSGANTIDFAAGLSGETITLSGQLTISNTTGTQYITGPSGGVTISGNNASGVFHVNSSVTASLSGLTITGGSVSGGGGGLYSAGTTTLTNVTVSGSTANVGGGLYSKSGGTVMLTNSTVSGNTAVNGGGMYNRGTATLTGDLLTGNTATGAGVGGGGLINAGTAMLTDVTVSGNHANFSAPAWLWLAARPR